MSLIKIIGLSLGLSVLTACGGGAGDTPAGNVATDNSAHSSDSTTNNGQTDTGSKETDNNVPTGETSLTNQDTDSGSSSDSEVDTSTSSTASIPESDYSVEKSKQNFLQRYAKATQGSNYHNKFPAQNAIDGDPETINHTGCNAKDNWLQIAFPSAIKLSSFKVINRSNNQARLNGTKVYFSSIPYKSNQPNLDDRDFVDTLNDNQTQSFSIQPAKEGRYLILKAEADHCLHIAEIDGTAEVASAPQFTQLQDSYLIPKSSSKGTLIDTIKSIDYQAESISYTLIGEGFNIDQLGNLRTTSDKLISGAHPVTIIASDGQHQTVKNIIINVTQEDAIEAALNSADASQVTSLELLEAAHQELQTLHQGDDLLSAIYQGESIDYTPGNRSQTFTITGDRHGVFPILLGNKDKILALAGTLAGTNGKSRFAAYGLAPSELFAEGESLSYQTPFKRVLGWLIGGKPLNLAVLNEPKRIALSFTKSNTKDIKSWLAENIPDWQVKDCHDASTLTSCYQDVDLVISGWQTDNENAPAVKNALQNITQQGTPVLYLHTWYEARNDVSQAIGSVFNFALEHGGNYWADDAAHWTDASTMQDALYNKLGYNAIDKMVQHFINADYSFDWSKCDGEDCSQLEQLESDFFKGARNTRTLVNAMDIQKRAVFTPAYKNQYRLEKLLVLIADKFRRSVSYPMDKLKTDDNAFMRSLFADHAVYNYRTLNPAQADMGNFSRSDFSSVTPVSKTVKLNSRRYFRSTGAYALPGQTFRISRRDNSDVTVKVFINTLRSGATHQFANNGYKRPKSLQTPHIEIKTGETLALTSPYGGPIQLEFSKNDLPVEVQFEHIGEHPYWASSADNQSFTDKLAANQYDWAEIATAGFEVHSKRDKIIQSIADPKWGGIAEGLARAVVKYTSNYPHVLAGFKGDGVDVVPEIHDWAKSKGITIETIDIMKHMNADQATCGYGCSGNPYDAYWAFNPIGHGDIHEMGHSMQMMRFEGFPNHAATNTFSYYTKSRYYENTGIDPDCGGQPFKSLFETIQSSVGKEDVKAYLKKNLWDKAGLGEQYLLKIEAMMHAQKMGKLQNGWHVLARVHILQREMKRAKQDWEARKAAVGFSNYTLDEINHIRNNDWLVIAYSYAAELDYRNYFDMMGIPYSQKAREQIASFGFDIVPNALFKSEDKAYCASPQLLDQPLISVDGTTVWGD